MWFRIAEPMSAAFTSPIFPLSRSTIMMASFMSSIKGRFAVWLNMVRMMGRTNGFSLLMDGANFDMRSDARRPSSYSRTKSASNGLSVFAIICSRTSLRTMKRYTSAIVGCSIDSTAAVAAPSITFAVSNPHASPAVDLSMLLNDAMSSSFSSFVFPQKMDIPGTFLASGLM